MYVYKFRSCSVVVEYHISEIHAASIIRVKWLVMEKMGIDIGLVCKWVADAARH